MAEGASQGFVMLVLFHLLLGLQWVSSSQAYERQAYNILLIISDDLRADIGGWYESPNKTGYGAYTPNLNSFQQDSVSFTRSYTQYAFCNPSRTSFLTGLRPDVTRAIDNSANFRDPNINFYGSSIVTMPQYFKQYGNYYTVGSGKIFHKTDAIRPIPKESCSCLMGNDEPYSWDDFWTCQDTTFDAQVCSELRYLQTDTFDCIQQRQNDSYISKFNLTKNLNSTLMYKLVDKIKYQLR